MARNDRGVTLIELMIAIACLLVVLLGAITLFAEVARNYKQQGKLAESGVERMIGLELLRNDIELAGYGVPWHLPPGFNYNEATSGTLNDAPSNPPRGVLCDVDSGINGSDRLLIKSAGVGVNAMCRRWTLLDSAGTPRTWVPPTENLANNYRVIVLDPGTTEDTLRMLVVSGTFHAAFPPGAGFASPIGGVSRVVYGVDGGASLRMPFNRAEYSIDNTDVPLHCAPGTGVLVKQLVRHGDGTLDTPLPLLDCVAAMEVDFAVDHDEDPGTPDQTWDGSMVSPLSAEEIRKRVKQVNVYLLVQEGQVDPEYTHAPGTIPVGPENYTLDPSTNPAQNQTHYRWRVHTVVARTINLGG